MRHGWRIAGALSAGLVLFVVLNNASVLAPAGSGRPVLLAHRGIYQTFSHRNLKLNDCTANRIDPPTNPFLENTIPSMAEAFRVGADIVELDVHETTDRRFAVFHDWTLDCRTDGHGVTSAHSMAYLKSLDVGYGYTADGGKTFPFRGKGRGLMPSLEEVLARFPGNRFLVNIKSNDRYEGIDLAKFVLGLPPSSRARLMFYGGGDKPLDELRQRLSDLVVMSQRQVKACGMRYIALGWTGYVPQACRRTIVIVPLNYIWLVWGWPDRFLARMRGVGSVVFVAGPYNGDVGLSGLDTKAEFDSLPKDYDGGIWTEEIATLGPLVRARR
jgi:glycerophosphoryl diester phosphodiesterase